MRSNDYPYIRFQKVYDIMKDSVGKGKLNSMIEKITNRIE